jgi:hypothetical protein
MSSSPINKRISQRKIGSRPKKILVLAEGGEVYTSGSYRIHVFTSTTSFRVFYKSPDLAENHLFDFLVFGGGNGGAAGFSGNLSGPGGGGDGGYGGHYTSSFSASLNLFNKNTAYTVTVGGAGSNSTIATNSTTIVGFSGGGAAGGTGVGNNSNGNPGSVPSTAARSIMTSIPSGFGPYPRVGGKEGYGFGGGGGGSGTGTGGGGGRSTEGSSSTSGNGGGFGSINGVNGAVNSSDGGGGGAGGTQGSPLNPNPPGGSGGLGGSGVVFIKYLFEK